MIDSIQKIGGSGTGYSSTNSIDVCNYSAKKVKRSKKRLDRVFLKKNKNASMVKL
jgi:hypothetical protein